MVSLETSSIIKGVLQRDRRSIARAISIVDNNENESRTIIKAIFEKNRERNDGWVYWFRWGAGKSTLIGKLVPEFRSIGYSVAILAVDPTSPITGGAILGTE